MQNKKGLWIAIGAILILGGLWWAFSGGGAQYGGEKGRVIFAVKDAAEAVNATSIMITIDKVEVHSATQGWVTVSNAAKQYDLLKLKASGAAELLADVNLPVDTYDQIRLNISRVDVTVDGKTEQAKLPSNSLKIVGKVVVTANTTSAVTLDFIADRSLHSTGSGRFILSPVVKLETRSNATVEVSGDNRVSVSGGEIDADEAFGMDEKGETKVDFELDGEFEIENDDVIRVGDDDDESDDDREVTIMLNTINNSGISGRANLSEENGKVKVELELVGGGALPQPAHIHVGVCPGVGAVKYPLTSVINGKSETTIATTLAGLKAELPLAINVHKSVAEAGTYVACGAINL